MNVTNTSHKFSHMNKLKILQYDSIDMLEEIEVKKTNCLQGFIGYHYWYFLEINLDFISKFMITVMI